MLSQSLLILLLMLLVDIHTTRSQVTQSSYDEDSDHHLHHNQIPPPEFQPEEDAVKQAMADLFQVKVDKNHDSRVSSEELAEWLESVHQKLIEDSVERQWGYYKPSIQEVHSWEGYAPEMKQVLNWEHFKSVAYPEEYLREDESNPHYQSMSLLYKRSEKRWKLADANSDTVLTKDEFKDFIHPEESEKTRDILVDEAQEDMDADSDGSVTLDEYMKHLSDVTDETEKSTQDWVPTHVSHFKEFLDKNRDGKLDREELKEWIIPSYNRHEAEAYRLVTTADEDKDGELSVSEVTNHYVDFYSALPPDFWQKLNPETSGKSHDEL